MTYPHIEYCTEKLEGGIKDLANVHHRTVKMTNKKLCFFGDTNKVIVLDLHDESWTIKTINKPNCEFLYYAAAVTLPNGDALITGGGSSQTVFQFLTKRFGQVLNLLFPNFHSFHTLLQLPISPYI